MLDIFLQKNSENDEKKCNSLKKQSSKRSFEDLRSRFDKPAGKFHRKSEIFAQSLKTIKRFYFLFTRNSSKLPYKHVEYIFDKPA